EEKESEKEQPQVAEEADPEPPTIMVYYNEKKDEIMVVVEVAKTNIVFFNQEEVIGEAYQASIDQTIVVSVEEQTLESIYLQASAYQTTTVSVEEHTPEVEKTEVVISHQEEDIDEASQTKESKEEVEQNKEEVVEGKDDDDGNLQNKPDPEQHIYISFYYFDISVSACFNGVRSGCHLKEEECTN
ncbi:hypothetical protein GIB67_008982, partial [Kingdonia uniflora]